MMQNRQPISAARWNSRRSGPLPITKNSLTIGTGVLKELEELTKKLDLGDPSYKLAGGTESGRGYFCSVTIGGHHAGSLDEYSTHEQAQCAAATNAINLLKTYYAEKLTSSKYFQRPNAFVTATKFDKPKINTDSNQEVEDQQTDRTSNDEFERVVENLLILFEKMPRGIYSHALATKYLETYKQNLPADWLSKIKDGYPEFVIDEVDSFRSIIAKRRNLRSAPKVGCGASTGKSITSSVANIERPIFPTETTQKEPAKEIDPQFVDKREKAENGGTEEAIVEVNAHSTKVRFCDKIDERLFTRQAGEEEHEIILPPPLDNPPAFLLPEDTINWHVFVSVVKTPGDFMVRLLGEEYSDQYEQLQGNMQDFYEVKGLGRKLDVSCVEGNPNESLVGGVYAARAEECWHRVYVNEIIPADEGIADEGITVSVYFIDHGDCETIPFDDLRALEQKFMRLPCQATPACLAGLENFQFEDFTVEMMDRFRELTVGKVLAAQFVGATGGVENEIGHLLLLLAKPPEIKNAVDGDGSESACSSPEGEAPKSPTVENLLINELITQIAPDHLRKKIVAVEIQNESAPTGSSISDPQTAASRNGQLTVVENGAN